MDLHQIKYFLAVVDHNGINAAATVLGVAQPTISQAVQGLEREFGVALFHRIGRGMVLTSAGHSLVGPARRILRDVVAAQGSIVDAAGRPRGRLDVFAMPALSADPVARLVGAFRRKFPKVSIRIGDLRDETAAASLIREGHCEIVVCHLPAMDCAGLEVRELGVQEYWLVLPPGSAPPPDSPPDAPRDSRPDPPPDALPDSRPDPLPDAPPDSLPDPLPLAGLPDIPHVTVPRGSSLAVGEIEQAVAAAGRAIRPTVVVEHREARLPFVLAGVGATFLERSMAEAAAARGAVVRSLEPRISRAYGLVYDPAQLSPAGRAFVDVAANALT